MPVVHRPDGVELHWEQQGEGPLVVIAHQVLWSYPDVYADLIADLARDHRVVTYDPRGCGRSTRQGPYEPGTDAEDLLAVVGAASGTAVAVAVGYGYNLAVPAASGRPDLISHLLAIAPAAAAVLPRSELKGSGVMAASESVMDMIMQMLRTDPRTALRTLIAAANAQLNERQLRDRVERAAAYISAEAARDRAGAWLEDDPSEHARILGERLWILYGRAEALFEGALGERVAELYPQARLVEVGEGPITDPDLTAARVREATGAIPGS